ncbi:MAG TPA: lipoyl(octanoyl) transferase LipB [Chloroflexota bacterium]|nr:lipoyl(octanoyl) transferase LipB [Chloroflexota bacterium]
MRAVWLGLQDYDPVHDLQLRIRDAIIGGEDRSTLLLLEHRPVITFGRRGESGDLRATRDEIAGRGIAVRPSERGGQALYHGPGQLVGYVIAPLHALAPDVPGYVHRLEDVLIHTAAALGTTADRCSCGRGVWVGERKIGFVGVAISRGVCWHGLALNVAPDLAPFDLIRPCGLDVRVTSIREQRGCAPPMEEAARLVAHEAATVFGDPVDYADGTVDLA